MIYSFIFGIFFAWVAEHSFPAFSVIPICKIHGNYIQKSKNSTYNHQTFPGHCIHIFKVLSQLLFLILQFQSMRLCLILIILNIIQHFMNSQPSSFIMLLFFFNFKLSFFKLLTKNLIKEIVPFHNLINWCTVVISTI